MDEDVIIVQGEFETRLHDTISSVIIQIVCKNKEDAEEVLNSRKGCYKKLEIIQISKAKLHNKLA